MRQTGSTTGPVVCGEGQAAGTAGRLDALGARFCRGAIRQASCRSLCAYTPGHLVTCVEILDVVAQELGVAQPLRRAGGELRFGSAKARRGAFGGPLIFPQSVFAVGHARRTSSPCTARGAPGDNGPLRATRRGATPARPSSPSASPAAWRSSRALIETSADLLQQPRALPVRLLGARGAGLLASHRDWPRLSGGVSEASRAATRCTATCSAA